MALYDYKATDFSGKSVSGSMEAKDEGTLVARLQEMGYFPIKVGQASGEKTSKSAFFNVPLFSKNVRGRNITGFTHELASMLEAGVSLDRSLSILAELESNAAFKEIILEVLQGIRGGDTFADRLGKYPAVFSDIYVSMVRAGEAGGAIETVLARQSKYMEESQKLKDEISSALLYPVLLTLVGGSAVALMVLFVIPRFSVIFSDMGSLMPLPTRVLLGVSAAVRGYWWLMFAALAAAFLAAKKIIATETGRLSFDGLKLKTPLVGDVALKSAVSRFSRTLGTLLQSGLPIIEAMNIAVNTIGNAFLTKDIKPVIDGVRRGRGMTAPLKEVASFPPLAVHMLTIGEETGKLDEMLLKLSENYDHEINTSLKRLLSLLEPAIILVMAIVVGFIVISLLLAIFSLNDMPL